ncbi:SRPBCC family protein [Isoptericola cucumis]
MSGVDLHTSIDVDAPPERVWEVLLDVERWPEWTDSVTAVRSLDDGPLAVGSRVEVSQPRIPTGTYTVTVLDPTSTFVWEQRQPGSTVAAHHECAPLGDGGTRVGLRVVMSGAVGGVVGRFYRKRTEQYLAMEAGGLKRRAEGGDLTR